MGNNKTSVAYTHKPRVASFRKASKEGYLTPVNRRAHKLTRKLGKRAYVRPDQLKQFQGYYIVKVYTSNGVRRALKV